MDFSTKLEPCAFKLSRSLFPVLAAVVILTAGQKDAGACGFGTSPANEMTQSRYVREGPWGGSGIKIQVERAVTKIEYDCADGEIVGRLKLDAKGNFRATGSHTANRPGPVREGEARPSLPAVYDGHVSGDRMTLKITLSDTGEDIGTFQLRRNANPRMHRCL